MASGIIADLRSLWSALLPVDDYCCPSTPRMHEIYLSLRAGLECVDSNSRFLDSLRTTLLDRTCENSTIPFQERVAANTAGTTNKEHSDGADLPLRVRGRPGLLCG